MNKTKYCAILLLVFSILSSCTVNNSNSTHVKGIQEIIEDGVVPGFLVGYDNMSEQIFYRYAPGATVIARYVKENTAGTGDGSSWDNASSDIQELLNGINDARANKVYVVMIASGTYKSSTSYVMKNHVALVGGFTGSPGNYDRIGETRLDGNNNKKVFNNTNNSGLDKTSLLYGVTIINGNANNGGGMYNENSSPTLMNVTFSGNTGNITGGGMYNENSSPTLMNVTFSRNTGNINGGGMYNKDSSPTLMNVVFSGNTAKTSGGGMYNNNNSSPTLMNITFSGNTASYGGGMYNNNNSSSTLMNVTFSGNTGNTNGGGIYHDGDGQHLTLINTILWNNDNGNIFLWNDNNSIETVNLYYSLIKGGTNASTTATGIRLYRDDTTANPISINGKAVIADNPLLGTLANNGGEVNTISIGNNSPAKDKGIYVKRKGINRYYSIDNTSWFSDPGLTSSSSLPGNAEDFTATDARGYNRVGRPDMGAYEVGGTP